MDGSLFLERDEKILTSSQSCILPLENSKDSSGVEFNVRIHNYQYDEKNPAVLCIVVSPHGTSVQLLTEYKQKIYFNNHGEKAKYSAERLKEVRRRLNKKIEGEMDQSEKENNALFIFQIPLKQTSKTRRVAQCSNFDGFADDFANAKWYPQSVGYQYFQQCCDFGDVYTVNQSVGSNSNEFADGFADAKWYPQSMGGYIVEQSTASCYNETEVEESFRSFSPQNIVERSESIKGGIDNAQLFIGKNKFGNWDDLSTFTIKRDGRFPIRCTIQYYKVTDTNDIPENVIESISDQVWKHHNETPKKDKGSLVVESSKRITVADTTGSNFFEF